MGGLIVLRPVEVLPSMLETNVPEDDYPAYNPATAYAADARVIHGHFVWQSLQASNTGHQPDAAATWWVQVGPTNRWKAFDRSPSSQTVGSEHIWFEVSGSQVRSALALLNMSGVSEVRVRVEDGQYGQLYDRTVSLLSAQAQSNWYSWFFGKRTTRSDIRLMDLPSYPNATVRIDLHGLAAVAVGVILLGDQITLGEGVQRGARMSIRDYSRKETNQWGEVTLQQRAYSKTRSFSLIIKNEQLDEVDRQLTDLRATPVLWIATDSYDSPNVYGWYPSFDILLQYTNHSECNLDIEGLA